MSKEEEALLLLKSIRSITRLIEDLQEQIEVVRAQLTSTSIKPKELDVQTSGSKDTMTDNMIKLLDYELTLQNYQAELCRKKMTVIKVLSNLSYKSQEIINIRYLMGRTVEETAEELGRASYYHTWEAIHKAEEEFCKKYKEGIERDI